MAGRIGLQDPSPETEERWRRKLAEKGAEKVRLELESKRAKLTRAPGPQGDKAFFLGLGQLDPPISFVEDWLQEQNDKYDRRDTRRFWYIIAIGAAGVAVTLLTWYFPRT